MNLRFMKTEIFAFIILLFGNFVSVNAQNIYELPAGTTFRVQMDNEISSRVASVNDTFTVTLAAPVSVEQTVLLPSGTVVEGRVTKVKRALLGGKNGSIEVVFESLRMPNGTKRQIEGVLVKKLNFESSPLTNLSMVFGGTVLGGIVGTVFKGKTGALIGAGIGAGTGMSVVFLRKGREAGIKADEEFEIRLTKTVNLPVRDF